MPRIDTHYIGRAWEVLEYEPQGDTKYWRTVFKLDWLDKIKDEQRLHTIICVAYRKLDVFPGDLIEVWGEKGIQKNQDTGKWEDKLSISEVSHLLFPLKRLEDGSYPDGKVAAAGQNKQQAQKPQPKQKTRPQQNSGVSPEDEAWADMADQDIPF